MSILFHGERVRDFVWAGEYNQVLRDLLKRYEDRSELDYIGKYRTGNIIYVAFFSKIDSSVLLVRCDDVKKLYEEQIVPKGAVPTWNVELKYFR